MIVHMDRGQTGTRNEVEKVAKYTVQYIFIRKCTTLPPCIEDR